MIISHKHKFIFIKTRKTAGTSMEIALSKICGDDDIITKISPKDEVVRKEYARRTIQNDKIPLKKRPKLELLKSFFDGSHTPRFYNHMPCREIKELLPEAVWDSYFKFTLERNPFDKVVSLYYWNNGDKKYKNIYEFLTNGGLRKIEGYDLYSINKVVTVDKIYQYEHLDSICPDLSERLQLKEPLKLPDYRAKSHTRKVKDYKELLDKKSIELIKIIFAREIKLFGYQF